MSAPRVGFLGTGWIGRHRMKALVDSGAIEAAAICDPSSECAAEAARLAPGAAVLPSLGAMLDHGLDGLVIATPSAFHCEQATAALKRGVAVFCQKPLGRNAAETSAAVEAARTADRLLGVDLSYRHTRATQAIAGLIRGGELGDIFAVDLAFHNAYGPDKPWFYDRARSGGGCLIDLGVHLVDLALWLLGFPGVDNVTSRLFAGGQPLSASSTEVEDYAVGRLDLATGATVRLGCSWRLHAGQDAIIEASFYGARGAVSIRNLGGSFYDFEARLTRATSSELLAQPPDEWGGRAAVDWARRLAENSGFDETAANFVSVSEVLDRLYAAETTGAVFDG